MTISFVNIGPTVKAPNGNFVAGLPPGWQTNDIFICFIASLDNVDSTMPPAWISIDSGTNNGTGLRTSIFYKIAVTGDSNPLVTHPSGSYIEGTIVAYRGVDTNNPLDVIGALSINPYSSIVTATSITTTIDNSWVIFTGSSSSRCTFSSYSGSPTPIERVDAPNSAKYPSTFVTDFPISPAGSTGDRTAFATIAGVSNGLLFALRPIQTTIVCITDPSNANIYIDGVQQPKNTSTAISVSTGTHSVAFYKAGYAQYNTNITLTSGQTINVCAILQKLVDITGYGIVICTTSNISSCPITPSTCPISISPSDYLNFISILNSTVSISLTVNFTYTLNGTTYVANVPTSLLSGTNIVYAFPTNGQYPPNTIISLIEVTLS